MPVPWTVIITEAATETVGVCTTFTMGQAVARGQASLQHNQAWATDNCILQTRDLRPEEVKELVLGPESPGPRSLSYTVCQGEANLPL